MRALVLGGTRFFGKRLVEKLLASGRDVTIATRGRAADPFEDRVTRVVFDRDDAHQFQAALGGGVWDVVFDQLCYSSAHAEMLVETLGGRVRHVVLTSSGAVYERTGLPLTEAAFDPSDYPVRRAGRDDVSYAEGKRLSEALLAQQAAFPVTTLRFPVVIGPDDYTGRLQKLIKRVHTGQEIRIDDTDALVSFVSADDAARQLEWAGTECPIGPFNGASGILTVGALLGQIEHHVGRAAKLSATADPETAHGISTSSALDTAKVQAAGFSFTTPLHAAVAELCE